MKNLRQLVFCGLDYLKGGVIQKNYKEILSNDPVVRERYQEDILKYVQEHVPFYQGKNYQKLQDFPVMSKPIFKREGTNCISDEYSDYTKLHVVKTSGSTGTPLVVYLNKEKRQRVIADLLVVNDNIGWNLGAHYVFLRN